MSWNIPESIETKRLRIRKCRADDEEAFVKFMTDEKATRHILFEAEQKTAEGAKALLAAVVGSYASEHAIFALTIADKASDRFIGSCGLAPQKKAGSAECYYTLLPEVWGRGYATEALGALVNYGFTGLKLDELYAYTSPENKAATLVAIRAGFQDLGTGPYGENGLSGRIFRIQRGEVDSKADKQ